MGRDTKQMNLVLSGSPDSDQEELDALIVQLREQLLELDVDRVELTRSGVAPAGAKPGELVLLGTLTVTLAPIALRTVLRLVEAWIEHRPVRTVGIKMGDDTLELQAVSSRGQRQLIDAFVAAHGQTPPGGAGSRPSPELRSATSDGA
ncbi:hypothetical protein ABZY09_39450 [Streptomyces sp. NPDC002928]|uniref:hypothetical protein n=1 Tax=Streptomyces sp. NPDC002928 TaxID=3154440 RepID=UPI0033A40C87